MKKIKKVAISCGDINGVGLEILLKAHSLLPSSIQPLYCVHFELLETASKMLKIPLSISPSDCLPPTLPLPTIHAGQIKQESGKYSFESFILGCDLCDQNQVDMLCTLPIHKKAWDLAGIPFIGHTQALSHRYQREAIMMLGCEKMFVALFSDHIPLSLVSQKIKALDLFTFLMRLYELFPQEKYCVLGINPHCGDGGVIGNEDEEIQKAIAQANQILGSEIFKGPYPSDGAFIPSKREEFRVWIAMYHDVGLAPLKALFFDESINISLNLPILRTSVDHGVAFDIAYKGKAGIKSYLNALNFDTHKL